jgi:hypothetical protein
LRQNYRNALGSGSLFIKGKGAQLVSDLTVRVRRAALALVEALGADGGTFIDTLRLRAGLEEEPELRESLVQRVGQLDAQVQAEPQAVAG